VAARTTRLNIDWQNPMADTPASIPRPQLSSVFDDMLAKSKRSFDDLYRGGFSRSGESLGQARPMAARTAAAARPAAGSLPSRVDPDSAAVRWLNEHFGGDWRYEISAQKREGDEAIVLGKLTFGRENAIRTQFGRAEIAGDAVAASSGGVRFKVGGAGSEQDEHEAFRRAAEAALSNCVDLI
jgi:hypothetical protein